MYEKKLFNWKVNLDLLTINLAKLIKNKIDVNILPVYKSFNISRYFQMKSNTPLALCSNVVYKFICSCIMNLIYHGRYVHSTFDHKSHRTFEF